MSRSEDPGDQPTRAADEPLQSAAVRNGLWSMLALSGVRLISFVTVAILARLLPDQYGAIAALMTVLFYLEAVLDAGVGTALIYEQEGGRSRRVDVAFTVNLVIASCVALTLFVWAPAIAGFFHIEDEAVLFRILGLAMLLRGFYQIPDALLKRDLQFRGRAGVALSRGMTRMAVVLGLVWAGFGVEAAAWGLVAAELVAVVGVLRVTSYIPRLHFDRSIMGSLLKFSLAIVGVRLLGQLALNGDYLIVGHRLGDTDLGVYYNAFRIPELAIAGTYLVFSDIALTLFSRARSLGEHTLRNGILKSLEILCLFGFPVGLGLAIAAESAVLVVFGPDWTEAAAPMVAISLAAGIAAIAYASGDILPATGRPHLLLWLTVIHMPIQFTILIIGTEWGVVGVAWAQFVQLLIFVVVRVVVASRVVDVSLREQLAAMVPGAVAAVGVLLLALPVARRMDPGLASLMATTLAGALGALIFVRLFAKGTLLEVVGLVRDQLRPK